MMLDRAWDFLRKNFLNTETLCWYHKKTFVSTAIGCCAQAALSGRSPPRCQKSIDSINSPSRGAWWKPISSQRVMQSFFGDLLLYRSIAHLALSPNSLAGSSPSGIELLSVAARYWIKLCDRTSTTPTSPHKSKHFAGDSNLPIFTWCKGDIQ